MVNMAARPLFSSPTSQPLAPSKFITQVAEPLIPIFFSMEPQLNWLRSPREQIGRASCRERVLSSVVSEIFRDECMKVVSLAPWDLMNKRQSHAMCQKVSHHR